MESGDASLIKHHHPPSFQAAVVRYTRDAAHHSLADTNNSPLFANVTSPVQSNSALPAASRGALQSRPQSAALLLLGFLTLAPSECIPLKPRQSAIHKVCMRTCPMLSERCAVLLRQQTWLIVGQLCLKKGPTAQLSLKNPFQSLHVIHTPS